MKFKEIVPQRTLVVWQLRTSLQANLTQTEGKVQEQYWHFNLGYFFASCSARQSNLFPSSIQRTSLVPLDSLSTRQQSQLVQKQLSQQTLSLDAIG